MHSNRTLLRQAFLLLASAAISAAQTITFSGELIEGGRFERPLGGGLVFLLIPTDTGWNAEVQLRSGSANLASCVCCPLHGPRVFEIQSWNYFGEHRHRPAINDIRRFNFSLTERDYANACRELGVIDGDVRRGSTTLGAPGYRQAPTGRCTLRIKRVSGKSSIQYLSFSASVRLPDNL